MKISVNFNRHYFCMGVLWLFQYTAHSEGIPIYSQMNKIALNNLHQHLPAGTLIYCCFAVDICLIPFVIVNLRFKCAKPIAAAKVWGQEVETVPRKQ